MPRKQKTIHYIYKTTCLVTGRYYIGMHSTSNLDDGYIGSGKRLRYSIRKHGEENHAKEILGFFDSRELLIEAEKKAITPDMITDNNCMNLKSGGEGGFISEEQQRHRSQCGGNVHKERMKNDKEYRDKVIKIVTNNIKKYHKSGVRKHNPFEGKTHSEKTKLKMSKKRKNTGLGKENSQYGTCWITKNGINKKIRKEEVEKFIKEGWVKGRN